MAALRLSAGMTETAQAALPHLLALAASGALSLLIARLHFSWDAHSRPRAPLLAAVLLAFARDE